MAVFAVLDYERKVQLNDKTRLNASKCFSPTGSDPLESIEVTPGGGATAVEVYNATEDLRYLDWAYSTFTWDVDSSLNTIAFSEGSSDYVATLASANYTLATLATQIATQMTAAGSFTYSASVANQKITLSATGAFAISTGPLAKLIGWPSDTVASSSQTGDTVEAMRKSITVTADNGTDTDTKTFYVMVYNEAGDYLFSDDGLLMQHEPDIMKWVPQGRATYLDVHRRTQELIMAWIDEKGFVDDLGNKYTKFDIKDLDEVRQWSGMMSLRLIFEGISNAVDDVFAIKAKRYALLEEASRQRAVLRIDTDSSGEVEDTAEGLSISSGSLFRR